MWFLKQLTKFFAARFSLNTAGAVMGLIGPDGTILPTVGKPYTFANLPAASSVSGAIARVTDIGPSGFGSLWYSDGSIWRPINGKVTLTGSGQGYILPGVSAASTVSLTENVATVINGGAGPTAHNIPATTFDGYKVYFPGSGNIPAGWYPGFSRTSTTAYTFNYTHADIASESVNGAAAYTSETTAVTYTLPGGAMGTNGSVEFHSYHDWNNSAGAKTVRVKFGGTTILTQSPTTSASGRSIGPAIFNRNSAAIQLSGNSGGTSSIGATFASGNQNVRTTINTANDVTILYTLQCAAATDFVTLGAYSIDLTQPG